MSSYYDPLVTVIVLNVLTGEPYAYDLSPLSMKLAAKPSTGSPVMVKLLSDVGNT